MWSELYCKRRVELYQLNGVRPHAQNVPSITRVTEQIAYAGRCAAYYWPMGYNARNDEIRDNITRVRREWEAQRGALATVRRFNATLSAKGYVWFWPKIAAALTSKHHWLIIACDSCGTVVDLDLRVKPRDPEASIRVALRDIQCPRCNGHGGPRIIALARHCG